MLTLSDEEHKNSKEPIVQGCKCYTCKNYNRAYLYHMLEVKEMNANILIAIHNVEQFDHFFQMIRDNFSELPLFIEDYICLNLCEKPAKVTVPTKIEQ